MTAKIKVAIADDHPLMISGLHYALSSCNDMEVTGAYANGQELLSGLAKIQPDVLLLDIHMPGQTGDELADIIAGRYPQIKMLALTNQDSVYYVKTMLRKGVKGYILKTAMEPLLLEAIRKVHSGEQYLEPSLKEAILQAAIRGKKDLSASPRLTSREKEVLQYIARDLTSQQIGDQLFVSKSTIDSHRMSLLMKLGVKNTAGLVKKGIQLGLIE